MRLLVTLLSILFLYISCEKTQEKNSVPKSGVEILLEQAEAVQDADTGKKMLDSVSLELQTHNNDSVTRYLYRRLAIGYYNLNLYDRSLAAGKKIYRLALDEKDTLSMAKGLFYTGESFFMNSENDSAFYYYRQAEELYRAIGDTDNLGEVILYKAYIYFNAGEYVLCESEAFKALGFLKKAGRPTDIYNCYNLIATAIEGQNNNKEAITYFERALEELDNFKSEGYSDDAIALYKASCYNNMGLVYIKMDDHSQAIKIFKQALNYKDLKKNNPWLYAKLLNNIATARFKAGNNEGLPDLFYNSLKIRDSLDNEAGVVASSISLGEYYAKRKDTARAVNFLKSAYEGANAINSHNDILTSLKLLSSLDKENSSDYYSRYITVNDSLQEIAENTRNKFARIEYETDRLQGEKEELVKRNSFIIGVSAVLLLFVAAIFIIYYLNSKNKELLLVQEQQKANEEIYQLMFEQQFKIDNARKEEKNRIAMELHDGILNNIYAVRLNLEFINKKTDDTSIERRKEYIKELQNVESEIRGVSHDLSRNALFDQEKSFESILEFMITSQKNNFNTDFEAELDPAINWEGMTNVCKVNVYRIIQEALQNINKYSKAQHAKVEVIKENENIRVSVTDDGVGFDTEKAKGGIGIKNLKKRASQLSGRFEIVSAAGQGTKVEVVFPAEQ